MTDVYVQRFEIIAVQGRDGNLVERRYCRADLTDGSTVEHLPFPSAAAKFLEVAQHQRKPIRVVKSGEHPEFEFVEREDPFPRPEQSPPVPFEHVPPEHMVEEIKRQARRINETEFRTGGEKEDEALHDLNEPPEEAPEDDPCICDFPLTCGGNGMLYCMGCGGDLCVCGVCYSHGEMDCDGCDDCNDSDEDYDP